MLNKLFYFHLKCIHLLNTQCYFSWMSVFSERILIYFVIVKSAYVTWDNISQTAQFELNAMTLTEEY